MARHGRATAAQTDLRRCVPNRAGPTPTPPIPLHIPPGATRLDESSAVVIDGLLTDAERERLLAWLTSPGHDHAGPPPDDKWERTCVDRTGDAATWGLREEVRARVAAADATDFGMDRTCHEPVGR